MRRLSLKTLASVRNATLPGYDPRQVRPGIVHLGAGAFHRAHQAVYTDTILGADADGWGIIGASLRNPAVNERLAPQDFLYGVWTRGQDPAQDELRIIGAVQNVLPAGTADGRARLFDALSDPAIRIITLTITEAGYCHRSERTELDEDHPDIRHDLDDPTHARSAPGILCEGLSRRRQGSGTPVTVISCDNLSANGKVTASVVHQLATRIDRDLAIWIGENVRFPCSMVDRIVPRTTPDDITAAAERTGLEDQGLVVCEPYSRWVLEDDFATDRPRWEDAGALLVSDVAPYEMAKLRLLNAAHSAIAYLGRLAGYDHVHEAVAHPRIREFAATMMRREIAPTLPAIEYVDPLSYIEEILERFANSAIHYPTLQVAADGSHKLPERLLPAIRARLDANGSIRLMSLVVAAWIRFLAGRDDHGASFEFDDPMADHLKRLATDDSSPAERVLAFLQLRSVFGDLGENETLLSEVVRWYQALEQTSTLDALGRKNS